MSSPDKQSSGKLSKMAAKWPKHATDQPSKAPAKVPKSGIAKTKKSKLAIEKALTWDIIEKSIKQGEMAEIEQKLKITARKGESTEVKNNSKDEPMEVEVGEASKNRDIKEHNLENETEDVVEVKTEGDVETIEVIIEGVLVDSDEIVEEDAVEEKVFQKVIVEKVEEIVEEVIEKVKVEKKYEDKDIGTSTSSVDSSMEAEYTYSPSDEGATTGSSVEAESTTSASSVEEVQSSLFLDKSRKEVEDFTKSCAKVMGADEVDNKEKDNLGNEFQKIKEENKSLKDQVLEISDAEKSEHELQLGQKVEGEAKEAERNKKEGGAKLKGDEEKPKV